MRLIGKVDFDHALLLSRERIIDFYGIDGSQDRSFSYVTRYKDQPILNEFLEIHLDNRCRRVGRGMVKNNLFEA